MKSWIGFGDVFFCLFVCLFFFLFFFVLFFVLNSACQVLKYTHTMNLISSFRFSVFGMSFIFTGKPVLSYFSLFIYIYIYILYFEIRCGLISSENRYAKWLHLKHVLSFPFLILINPFLFFNFSDNGRYEESLSDSYLEMTISCLSTDSRTHRLPSAIQSLILLIRSLPASSITVYHFH